MNAPVFLLLLLPALAALPLARRGGRVRAALAGAILLSLVLALSRPVVRIPRRAGTVVVVADRSASLPPAERDAQKALLAAVEARRITPTSGTAVLAVAAPPSRRVLSSDAAAKPSRR